MSLSPDQQKKLDAALAIIDKEHGAGTVMRMGEKKSMDVHVISSGILELDIALGVGGLPRGRVVEVFGPESAGKSTLALHLVKEAQKAGGICAYVDTEHALDPIYAAAIGVNIDELLISQPDTAEQALAVCEELIKSGALTLVIVDSVAALTPRAEIEGDMGDSHMGLMARLMSQALRKLTGNVSKTQTTLVFINQLREKIGVVFGNPEVTPGGRALKYYSSVRLDIRRIESLKTDGEIVGNRTRVKVVKNKVAPPFKQAEFDIMYGLGASLEGSVCDLGVHYGFIKKAGAWYSYNDRQLGQGRDKTKIALQEDAALCSEIEAKIREAAGLK